MFFFLVELGTSGLCDQEAENIPGYVRGALNEQTGASNPNNECNQNDESGVPVDLFNDWTCLCAAGFASADGDGKEYDIYF